MAETSNGGTAAVDARRQVAINAQYIKDLSFENPHAPQSLLAQQGAPPEVQINVNVKAQGIAQDIYEVVMTLRADAKKGAEALFVVELVYGAVVTLANTPPEDVGPALMVETPRQLFPFVRALLAQVTREGGFAPLMLSPMDFNEIYRSRMAQPPGPIAV